MLLGNKLITSGDTRRYEIDYAEFLQHGDIIATATVTQNGPTSSVSQVSLDVSKTKVFFFLTGGIVNESLIASVKVITVIGETINDTIAYTVIAA